MGKTNTLRKRIEKNQTEITQKLQLTGLIESGEFKIAPQIPVFSEDQKNIPLYTLPIYLEYIALPSKGKRPLQAIQGRCKEFADFLLERLKQNYSEVAGIRFFLVSGGKRLLRAYIQVDSIAKKEYESLGMQSNIMSYIPKIIDSFNHK